MMRWFLILLIALPGLKTEAQEAATAETQVTFIAGQTIYVSSGTGDGLVVGDTVDVIHDGIRLGSMIVVSATPDRAVLGFTEAIFSITMGDRLTLRFARAEPEPVAPAPTPVLTERPSILEPVLVETQPQTYSGPRVSGRLQVGVSGLMSSTSSNGGASFDRTYATPFALLRAEVANLPGGFQFNTHLRAAYRYADPTPFSEEVDIRVYDLNIERSFTSIPLEISAGRLFNRYDRFSGYWDGLNVHVGNGERGFGVVAGFQPDRGNELPTADLPKYTVFGHAAYETESVRFDGTVLGGQIFPKSDSLQTRTYAGFQQQIFAGGLRLSAEALVDQDPETDAWTFSRLSARANVTVTPSVRIRGFASSSRPYILYADRQYLLRRSTRLGGGATVSLHDGPVPGLSVRVDVSNAMTEGQPNTISVNGGISVPGISSARVGVSVDGTVWQNQQLGENRRGIYGGIGVNKSFGATYARLGYRYQQSPLLGLASLVTHGLDAMVQVPFRSGIALTLQASTQIGQSISSTRLYTAIWYRF